MPADVTINCEDDYTDLTFAGDVTDEADNCDTDLDATYSDNLDLSGCNGTGTITRTWTLVDDCGNTTTDTQLITVVDTEAPTFTVPADATLALEDDYTDLNVTLRCNR